MLSKITRILTIFLIVAISVSVIYLNPEPITLHYGGGKELTAMGGFIFLICFALGVLISLYLWIVYGMKVYLRERSFRTQELRQEHFNTTFVRARGFHSMGKYAQARNEWKKILKHDPTNLIAQLELSKTLQQEGELSQALKVIDRAREISPTNIEVLLQAAHLNEAVGNKTAALDNLALILYHDASAYAADKARSLSLALGRIEDAKEYQRQYESLGGDRDDYTALEIQYTSLKTQLTESQSESEKGTRKANEEWATQIRSFVKKHPYFLPATLELFNLEKLLGKDAEAAELLVKAARETHDPNLWKQAIEFWIERGNQERALSAARTAVRHASTKRERQLAHLHLARAYVLTYQPEQALLELADLSELEVSSDSLLRNEYLALKGYGLHQQEHQEEASQVWRQLLHIERPRKLTLVDGEDEQKTGETFFPVLKKEKR
jgi:tetratricopeptide (TPR) repeat protein